MNDPLTTIIIWASPFLACFAFWAINKFFEDTKSEISEVKNTVFTIKRELVDLGQSIIRIETDLSHIKNKTEQDSKKNDQFETQVVTILRNAKKRF